MRPATPRQLELHAWMLVYQREHGAPPSTRTLAEHFGIRSTKGIHDHMVSMAKKGLVRKGPVSWTAIDSMPPPSSLLERLRDELGADLERIAARFRPGAKLTLVIRHPDLPGDTGIVVTDDDLDAAIAEIRKQARTGTVTGGAP